MDLVVVIFNIYGVCAQNVGPIYERVHNCQEQAFKNERTWIEGEGESWTGKGKDKEGASAQIVEHQTAKVSIRKVKWDAEKIGDDVEYKWREPQ